MERDLKAMSIELKLLADNDFELTYECKKLCRDIAKFLDKNGDRINNLYDRYNDIMLKYLEKEGY